MSIRKRPPPAASAIRSRGADLRGDGRDGRGFVPRVRAVLRAVGRLLGRARGRIARGGPTPRAARPVDHPALPAPAAPGAHVTAPHALEPLLRAILDELRGLRADLRTRGQPAPLTPEDRTTLQQLLPVIAATLGSGEFYSARDLRARVPRAAPGRRGSDAAAAGAHAATGGGHAASGYVVQRGTSKAGALLWHVVEVAANRNLSVPHAAALPMRRWRRELTDV